MSAAKKSAITGGSTPPPVEATTLIIRFDSQPTNRAGMGDGLKPCALVLAPGTASGYRRVKKINGRTYQAQRTVGGTQQHVWTSDDPRECKSVRMSSLASELKPLSEEAIKAACKDAAKERHQLRALKRKQAELSRDIHRLYEAQIAGPKRAKEARELALAEANACREREADTWYASLVK